MDRTWPENCSSAVAAVIGAADPLVLKRGQELDETGEFLLRQAGDVRGPGRPAWCEHGHDAGRVGERPGDRLGRQLRADLGQLRAWPVVAVVAELVACQAAGLRRDLLS